MMGGTHKLSVGTLGAASYSVQSTTVIPRASAYKKERDVCNE